MRNVLKSSKDPEHWSLLRGKVVGRAWVYAWDKLYDGIWGKHVFLFYALNGPTVWENEKRLD